ncbi:MAG: SDR family NAD(P)-dependent oxidoreductase [Bryobacteraceae bacterium]
MARLKNKVAVITGASKGIGAAIAEKFAEEGAAVAVNYARSANEANQVVDRIKQRGGKAFAVRADLSKISEIKPLFEKVQQEFGHVDIIVNNAGVYEFLPLGSITEEHFNRQYDLNVKGLVFATQEAVSRFGDRGGNIINVSSVVSTAPTPNGSVYSSTKAAVDAITRSLAVELGSRKIRVNSVLPGPVETEGTSVMPGVKDFFSGLAAQTPLGRVGQPQDIANTVAFLASDESGWLTGQTIYATGGLR